MTDSEPVMVFESYIAADLSPCDESDAGPSITKRVLCH